MKKELSVVFPVYKEGDKYFLLMGKQAEGKKLAGFRNGYGGKCEEGENTLVCARRELEEELGLLKNHGIVLIEEDFHKIGSVFMDDKQIDFYVIYMPEKIPLPEDSTEFVDTKWFDLEHGDGFVSEMLSGDGIIIQKLNKYLRAMEEGKEWKGFEINKTGNKELEKQVKNIYK